VSNSGDPPAISMTCLGNEIRTALGAARADDAGCF